VCSIRVKILFATTKVSHQFFLLKLALLNHTNPMKGAVVVELLGWVLVLKIAYDLLK